MDYRLDEIDNNRKNKTIDTGNLRTLNIRPTKPLRNKFADELYYFIV